MNTGAETVQVPFTPQVHLGADVSEFHGCANRAPRAAGALPHGGSRRDAVRGWGLHHSILVITAGQIEIFRPSPDGADQVTVHGPGQFTGEVNMLAGRRSLVSARVSEAGPVIEMDRERLLAVVLGDSEISEILMRAFILRRGSLLARGLGDAIVIGSAFCAETQMRPENTVP